MGTAPHSTPELVKLSDAEPGSVQHHHHRRIGDVHPHLDDGGGHQHVKRPQPEEAHRLLLLGPTDPTVEQPDPQIRQCSCRQVREHLLG